MTRPPTPRYRIVWWPTPDAEWPALRWIKGTDAATAAREFAAALPQGSRPTIEQWTPTGWTRPGSQR